MPNYHGKPIEYVNLTPYAKRLRKDQTEEEALLWAALKGGKLEGMHFRRQHPIKPYIVDFACLKSRLVVELDGGHHQWEDVREADEKRDAYLKKLGLTVLRFPNAKIRKSLPQVLQQIAALKT